MINATEAREELRQWLVKHTGCAIQAPYINEATAGEDDALQGWPCGTCTMHLLTEIGLDSADPLYQDRNEEPDRHNEVWRAILQIREAHR
jgi:hypothetical protein